MTLTLVVAEAEQPLLVTVTLYTPPKAVEEAVALGFWAVVVKLLPVGPAQA